MKIVYRAYNKAGDLLWLGTSNRYPLEVEAKIKRRKEWGPAVHRVEFSEFVSTNAIEQAIARERPLFHPAWRKSYSPAVLKAALAKN